MAIDALTQIQSLPSRLADDIVITTGELQIRPGSINIIPEQVELAFDIRTYDDAARAEAIKKIDSDTEYELNEIFQTDHTAFSKYVVDHIEERAEEVGASYQMMTSGAGHDAMYVNEITDTAMIFVPSVDGISHTEDEFTPWEDCVMGANVYANTTYKLSN